VNGVTNGRHRNRHCTASRAPLRDRRVSGVANARRRRRYGLMKITGKFQNGPPNAVKWRLPNLLRTATYAFGIAV
jgi:hypothetical protein